MAGTLSLEPHGIIGATIDEVDLSNLDSATTQSITQALHKHQVLFFHHQELDAEKLLRVAAQFGDSAPYPFVPGLPSTPEVIEVIKRPDETVNFGGVWHSDTAYLPSPAKGALLYAVEVPDSGGDTLFTSMKDVLRSLSPGMYRFLKDLTAINDADSEAIAATRPDQATGSVKKNLRAEHPVICEHPETGDEYLFVNRAHTTHFSGMTRAESQPLLEYLFAQIERPEFSTRFHWHPGSLALWDNRACQHYPLNDYQGSRRRMLRVSLAGTPPKAA